MSYQIITINREFESAGSEIAQAVATKLALPYYDRFLITAPAEASGVDTRKVEYSDERLESRFEYSQAQAAFTYTNNHSPIPTGARLAEYQFQLIRELADQGPCVIVGRCANHVLRQRDDVLDVFIHAGVEFRVNRTMEKLGLSERQAMRVLKQTDKNRKGYYKYYTSCDWNNPDLYHACLNPDRLGIDACVDTICALYRL